MMERQTLEDLSADLMARIEQVIMRALELAGVTKDTVHAVEIVGGTTRIPSVKAKISAIFGKELSTTLNQDECVAKGCALMVCLFLPFMGTCL